MPQRGCMEAAGENEALDHVVARLRARFPKLSTEYVRRVVHGERDRLVKGTGRDLAPAQVEDAAMEELRKEADPVRLRAQDESH